MSLDYLADLTWDMLASLAIVFIAFHGYLAYKEYKIDGIEGAKRKAWEALPTLPPELGGSTLAPTTQASTTKSSSGSAAVMEEGGGMGAGAWIAIIVAVFIAIFFLNWKFRLHVFRMMEKVTGRKFGEKDFLEFKIKMNDLVTAARHNYEKLSDRVTNDPRFIKAAEHGRRGWRNAGFGSRP